MDEDYIHDNFNGVRVIMVDYKIYVQREYMVTGYEDDGTYNPCIDTVWKTLVQEIRPIDKIKGKEAGYKTFSSLIEMIKFFMISSPGIVGYSSMYADASHIDDFQIIATEESIRENYVEYFL